MILYRLTEHGEGVIPQMEGLIEEMTINYEAGAKARYKEYAEDAAQRSDNHHNHPWSWYELPRVPKTKFRHDAKVTIDAALGINEDIE